MLEMYVKLYDGREGSVKVPAGLKDGDIIYPSEHIRDAIMDTIGCSTDEVKEVDIMGSEFNVVRLVFDPYFRWVDTVRFRGDMDIISFRLVTYGSLWLIGMPPNCLEHCEVNTRTTINNLEEIVEKNPDAVFEFRHPVRKAVVYLPYRRSGTRRS